MNNLSLLKKIIFFWKKPKIIIITGSGRKTTTEAIFFLLNQYFKVGRFKDVLPNILNIYRKEILIIESDLKNSTPVEKFKFLVRQSQLPILVITHFGDIPPDRDLFVRERKDVWQSKKLAKILPVKSYLILNFDDETVKEIKEETNLKEITFGFQEGADFRATDIKLNPLRNYQGLTEKQREQISNGGNSGTNFKINYKGNIVPVWLEKLFSREQIYSVLVAAAVGTIFDLNLVEISHAFKNYRPLLSET